MESDYLFLRSRDTTLASIVSLRIRYELSHSAPMITVLPPRYSLANALFHSGYFPEALHGLGTVLISLTRCYKSENFRFVQSNNILYREACIWHMYSSYLDWTILTELTENGSKCPRKKEVVETTKLFILLLPSFLYTQYFPRDFAPINLLSTEGLWNLSNELLSAKIHRYDN
jgi:hypothetical protein